MKKEVKVATVKPKAKRGFSQEVKNIKTELREIEAFISMTVIRFFQLPMDDHTQQRLDDKRKRKAELLERLKEITS